MNWIQSKGMGRFFVGAGVLWVACPQLWAIESAHRVKVEMISRQSAIHTTLTDRVAYRVTVLPKHGQPFGALLVDNYPSYAASVPASLEDKGSTFIVKLRRTPDCDRDIIGSDGEPLRCFAVEHGSWKATGHRPTDSWWK